MGRHYCSACNSTAVDIHSVLGSADGTVLYGTMVCLYRLIALRNYIGLLCRDFKKCAIANCQFHRSLLLVSGNETAGESSKLCCGPVDGGVCVPGMYPLPDSSLL